MKIFIIILFIIILYIISQFIQKRDDTREELERLAYEWDEEHMTNKSSFKTYKSMTPKYNRYGEHELFSDEDYDL